VSPASAYVLHYQHADLQLYSIGYLSPKHSRFAPKWFIWTFIPFDIVSLILQAIGGAMSSTSDGASSAGVNIALAGLCIQVITLFVFCVLVVDYLIRSRSVWMKAQLPTRFKVFCSALALATILILIRCAYRIYELSEGYSRDSTALRDEGLFIGLESVLVSCSASMVFLLMDSQYDHYCCILSYCRTSWACL
jgi:hypothetical protein